MIDVNEAHRDYISGRIDWDTFAEVCYRYIEMALSRLFRVAPDERDDALGEFFPRLPALVDRYTDQGSSFEAYLTVSLRYFSRSRFRQKKERESREILVSDVESVLVAAEPAGDTCIDPEYESPPEILPRALISNTRTRDTIRRQILISFCKNLPLLDEGEVRLYTRRLQVPERLVFSLQTYILHRRHRFLEQRNLFRSQRDRHYVRMHAFQYGAQAEQQEDRRAHLLRRSEFHRRRWLYYRDRLRKQNIHLSNREVAMLLGIPKGSVDSAMANLNRRLEKIISSR